MTNQIISHKQILRIAIPLIVASFGYSIVSATDTFFLGHTGDKSDLAAIGIISPFYLVISLLGLSLSRGGQILIAKRIGEGRNIDIGELVRSMFILMILLAGVGYVSLKFGGRQILATFIDSPELLESCYTYLYYRVDGIFMGFIGAGLISFYTGISKTYFITIDSLILLLVNGLLNYVLIYGYYGFEPMGIKGAGIASAAAENLAGLVFLIYFLVDKDIIKFKIFKWSKVNTSNIKEQFQLSTPITLQSVLGLASWVAFFGFVENMGEQPLAVSSVGRVLYVFLGVPAWGFASATNTIISNLMGEKKYSQIFPTLLKITLLSLIVTVFVSGSLLVFPRFLSSIVTNDISVVEDSIPILYLIFFILLSISMYNVFYNGIVGMGRIKESLYYQFTAVVFYVAFVYIMVEVVEAKLVTVWCAEFFHPVILMSLSLWFLKPYATRYFRGTK